MLHPGDTVTIYQYPITRQSREGQAKLVRQISPDEGDGLSRWVVRFYDDPHSCFTRTVYSPTLFSERELRNICQEEINVALDCGDFNPSLLIEHVARCYNQPELLNDDHAIWEIARQVCQDAEFNDR